MDILSPFLLSFECFSFTLTALVRLQYCRRDVYAVMDVSRTLRIPPSLAFLNSCIKALADHGDLVGACRVMDRMNLMGSTSPDTCSYNSLIYALIQEPWIIEVGAIYMVTTFMPSFPRSPHLIESGWIPYCVKYRTSRNLHDVRF